MRSGKIVRHSRARSRGNRQGEVNRTLPHQPDTRGTIASSKKDKSGQIRSGDDGGEVGDLLASQGFTKAPLSQLNLRQNADCLLPFARARDVTKVAPAEIEHGKSMGLVVVIMPQPAPRLRVRTRQLIQRRGTKLGMLGQKPNDLQSVCITNQTHTAAPGI